MSKGLGRGYFLLPAMPVEPSAKRAVVFVDGQNLFHAAREAFGYTYPNYDVLSLARRICEEHGWTRHVSIPASLTRGMTPAGTPSGRRSWP